MYTIYRLTSGSGCYSDFTTRAFAEKELQNLISNGKTGAITESAHYLPGELKAMANSRRKYGKHPASDHALMVLLLMETESHANNYCAALREVLDAFPEINREALEAELYRFI